MIRAVSRAAAFWIKLLSQKLTRAFSSVGFWLFQLSGQWLPDSHPTCRLPRVLNLICFPFFLSTHELLVMGDGDINNHYLALGSNNHHYTRLISNNSSVSDKRLIPVRCDMTIFDNLVNNIPITRTQI